MTAPKHSSWTPDNTRAVGPRSSDRLVPASTTVADRPGAVHRLPRAGSYPARAAGATEPPARWSVAEIPYPGCFEPGSVVARAVSGATAVPRPRAGASGPSSATLPTVPRARHRAAVGRPRRKRTARRRSCGSLRRRRLEPAPVGSGHRPLLPRPARSATRGSSRPEPAAGRPGPDRPAQGEASSGLGPVDRTPDRAGCPRVMASPGNGLDGVRPIVGLHGSGPMSCGKPARTARLRDGRGLIGAPGASIGSARRPREGAPAAVSASPRGPSGRGPGGARRPDSVVRCHPACQRPPSVPRPGRRPSAARSIGTSVSPRAAPAIRAAGRGAAGGPCPGARPHACADLSAGASSPPGRASGRTTVGSGPSTAGRAGRVVEPLAPLFTRCRVRIGAWAASGRLRSPFRGSATRTPHRSFIDASMPSSSRPRSPAPSDLFVRDRSLRSRSRRRRALHTRACASRALRPAGDRFPCMRRTRPRAAPIRGRLRFAIASARRVPHRGTVSPVAPVAGPAGAGRTGPERRGAAARTAAIQERPVRSAVAGACRWPLAPSPLAPSTPDPRPRRLTAMPPSRPPCAGDPGARRSRRSAVRRTPSFAWLR